ncbi:hypothetical protein L6452_26838 [Arctium lappa]|uniref:Uncharacterized protein n=1 Tax=Arctium lappa TaxID=4217 RepID=A0ACB8ZVE6_ARCLA|nr:hypothetical protein L6452_26838 [Arctium lappa]
MKNKKKGHNIKDTTGGDAVIQNLSPSIVLLSHLICGIGLASSFWLAINVYSINLIDNPASTLRLIWVLSKNPQLVSSDVYIYFCIPLVDNLSVAYVDHSLSLQLPSMVHLGPIGSIDYMICLPAHGAVIGGWFGAWPMPLDWERTWQEWPICVTYGAIIGYLVGMFASFCCVVFHVSSQHVKGD